ncbi:transposable element Tcb2 transposase [Trichonephila clavipes]|nr:transposable element Tcb2 transposase [Trichonephila clavipes]
MHISHTQAFVIKRVTFVDLELLLADLLRMSNDSRFSLESDSGRLLIWRERNAIYHQSNTIERPNYRGGEIIVWAGISLGGHTDLYVFQGGTLTGVRYRDEILDPYVHPYTVAIGNDFILMDDNARPYRAVIVEENILRVLVWSE